MNTKFRIKKQLKKLDQGVPSINPEEGNFHLSIEGEGQKLEGSWKWQDNFSIISFLPVFLYQFYLAQTCCLVYINLFFTIIIV
ncbi:MAG: hypothetical protein D3924_00100 [Candidatus Electrothrix sp. AR4]|nr:hypothetical protein [Candidatus Electrothrix sp. AR4]